MNWYEDMTLKLDLISAKIKAREDAAARHGGGINQRDGRQGVPTEAGLKAIAVPERAAGDL